MEPEDTLLGYLASAWRELAACVVALAGLAAVARWASVRWELARHVERPPRCPHCGRLLDLAPGTYRKRGDK